MTTTQISERTEEATSSRVSISTTTKNPETTTRAVTATSSPVESSTTTTPQKTSHTTDTTTLQIQLQHQLLDLLQQKQQLQQLQLLNRQHLQKPPQVRNSIGVFRLALEQSGL